MDTQQQINEFRKELKQATDEFRSHEKTFIEFSATAEERYTNIISTLQGISEGVEKLTQSDNELEDRVLVLETRDEAEKKTSRKFYWLILGLATALATILAGPAGYLFQKLIGG